MIQIDMAAIVAALEWRHLWWVLAASLVWNVTRAFVVVTARYLGVNI